MQWALQKGHPVGEEERAGSRSVERDCESFRRGESRGAKWTLRALGARDLVSQRALGGRIVHVTFQRLPALYPPEHGYVE